MDWIMVEESAEMDDSTWAYLLNRLRASGARIMRPISDAELLAEPKIERFSYRTLKSSTPDTASVGKS